MFRKFTSLLLLFSFLLVGCGDKSEDELIDEALVSANQALSVGDCQTAIDLLEQLGRKNDNARYLIVLASAYACRGGYNELTLFATDIAKVGTPSSLGGFINFTTSDDMTSPTDSDYVDLQTAIEILLFAGGLSSAANATSEMRRAIFGNAKGGDIDAFLMYMVMVQMGRFLRYYGTPDASANKTKCMLNYDNVALDAGNLDTILGGGLTGPCVVSGAAVGNADLGAQNAYNETRVCQGVVLFNTFMDVLPAVLDSYSGNELTEVSLIRTGIEAQKTAMLVAKASTVTISNTTSFTKCEADNAPNYDDIQIFYAYMFEPLYL
ncbi:MAG: hypothetical protein KC493_05710 [Bacteriovoracaceae bacterium]|nr:hypothetical protein [Bacteriovoracaceae bacterium]